MLKRIKQNVGVYLLTHFDLSKSPCLLDLAWSWGVEL